MRPAGTGPLPVPPLTAAGRVRHAQTRARRPRADPSEPHAAADVSVARERRGRFTPGRNELCNLALRGRGPGRRQKWPDVYSCVLNDGRRAVSGGTCLVGRPGRVWWALRTTGPHRQTWNM